MDELETLFKADAQHLRDAAPSPPPAWRLHQLARERAAMRLARSVRWAWRIAALLLAGGIALVALHDPRMVPTFAAPFLMGALACWRDAPGRNSA